MNLVLSEKCLKMIISYLKLEIWSEKVEVSFDFLIKIQNFHLIV